MARFACLLVLCACVACGAAPIAPANARADAVLLVQIDGLSAAVLNSYQRRPGAQAKDRLLARVDGVMTTALADIGVDAETAATTLIAEASPATLTSNTPLLFDLVPGNGVAAGFPAGKRAQAIMVDSDAERVEAVLAAPKASLVAVRLTGLAEAQTQAGISASYPALAKIDAHLARLHAHRPDALLIVVGTGAAPRKSGHDQAAAKFAKYLKVSPDAVRAFGGALRVDGLDVAGVGALDSIDFTRAVFHRTADGLKIFDHDFKALRPAHAEEFPTLPALLPRLERALAVGETLAVVDRAEGFDFQVGELPAKIARGGAAAAESQVPILFVGRGARGSADGIGVGDVSGLIQAALAGVDSAAWRRLTTRPARACADAQGCSAVVERTASVTAAADALVVAGAYDAARWLDPAVPLPADESADPPPRTAAVRYAFEDEPRGFTPVQIEVPSAAHAAMIARVTSAEVVAWRDSVIAPVPYVQALGGPAYFSGPLMHADDYAALSRGVTALRDGDFEAAFVELGQAKGHTPEAESWRQVLLAFVANGATEVDEAPEYPTGLRGWLKVIAAALQIANNDDDVVLPPLPNGPSDAQRALYAAFKARAQTTLPCTAVDARARIDDLSRSQATFEAAGLLDFAARSAVDRAWLQADLDAAKVSIRQALALSEAPDGAPSRGTILSSVLMTTMTRPQLAAVIGPELDAASEAQLLWIQTQIAMSRAHGKDGVSRLISLVDGVAITRQPDLLVETIDFAIDGQSATAAAVVQALLASGGLASLLKPNAFQQLQVTLFLMERALQTVPAGDGPDERVARAMPPIVRAVMYTLQGDIAQARQALAAADGMLPMQSTFAAREAAVRAAGEDDDPAIAAWGPLTKGLIVTGRLIAAVMADDLKDGESQALTLIELLRRFAHAELSRAQIKGFEAPIDALAQVLIELARYATLSEDARKSPTASARILKAAQAFPLDAPDADPKVRPWLRLAGIAVHDVAWILAAKRDDDMLAQPISAMDALVASWKPESRLGSAGLYLLLATQHALPDLGALMESDDKTAAMQRLPKVRAALQTVVKAVRDQYPANTTVEALRQDKAERIFIEHVLHVLEDPESLGGDGLPDTLATTNAKLRAAAGGTRGDVRDILLLIEALLAESQGQYDAALRWAKTGAESPTGPAFAQIPALWPAVTAGINARKGDRKAALVALKAASAACPAGAHRFTLATAVHQAASGNTHGAKKSFKAARLQGRRAGNGGIDAVFKLNVQDDLLILQTMIQTPLLGTLLGRANGSFQLGAGGTSTAAETRSIGWHLAPQSSPADAAMDALTLEAWLALNRGDYGTAGTALSGMVSVMYGIDPRHIDGLPATDLPAMPQGAYFPRSARMVLWTTLLAEQHGFTRLAGTLTTAITKNASAEWADGPGGRLSVCDDETPDGAPPIIEKLHCAAPAPLARLMGGEEPARAMEAFVRARVVNADATAARQALADAVPTALPRPDALAALEAINAGVDARKTVRAAIEAGFACELLHIDRPAIQSQLIGESHVCGPLPRRIGLTQAALADGNATTILEVVRDGMRIEHAIAPNGRFAQAAWPLARKTMTVRSELPRLTKRAAAWRDLARELDRPVEAAWFEALRMASLEKPTAADAEKALVAAWKAGLRAGPALKYFKQVMAGDATAAQLELLK